MQSTRTVKVTIQGDPAMVEAVAARIREMLQITYESKNNHVQGRPGDVRRWLRVLPVEVEVGDG